ncbi:MAG: hypothetical protein MSA90_00480 [Faecalicatena sp.]|uniref:hypothetical protein n=1 Tax=Faecalicatena sp. TaxID=2005360 RepID=UPI00258D8A30|nr:hypothetical protein [Faecalicatena sp.]MCI6463932.1 hypothetical protein [Faecalicatena sp.]MDY5620832.1 hypothetical protein [Lachnospiraceae bacterium]
MRKRIEEKLSKDLKQLYKAPVPEGKAEFIRELEQQLELRTEKKEMSNFQFICQQIPYIRKWNWLLVVLSFVFTVLGIKYIDRQAVCLTAAFVPFLALAAVSEGSRSIQYGMDELELASRFPLKVIAASRLFLLGASNLILLTVSSFVLGTRGTTGILFNGAVIMIPYLLTAFLNLFIVRKMHGRESIYVCLGGTVLISGVNLLMSVPENSIYMRLSDKSLLLIFTAAVIMTIRECVKFMKQTEEYVWS